jgi:hypothetical protein
MSLSPLHPLSKRRPPIFYGHKYAVLKRRSHPPPTLQNRMVVSLPQAFRRIDASKRGWERKERKMTDRRRYRVIECRRVNAETYNLTIDGTLWSEVEWSPSRQRWCVQDTAGELPHPCRAYRRRGPRSADRHPAGQAEPTGWHGHFNYVRASRARLLLRWIGLCSGTYRRLTLREVVEAP